MKKAIAVAGTIWLAGSGIGCASRTARVDAPAGRSIAAPAPDAFQRQVRNAVDAGDGDLTVRAWQRHLVRHPEATEIRRQLAAHLERNGEKELAAEHRRIAAEREPENEQLWIEWSETLRAIGWDTEAEQVLARAATHSASTKLYSMLGIVRDGLGDHAAAETAHRQALANAATPESALHNNLGFSLLLQGRHAPAIEQFRAALALKPRSLEARGNLARALAREGSPAAIHEARQHWLAVTSTASAHNNVAAAWMEQGRWREARQELTAALNADPTHRAARENLALVAQLDGGKADWTLAAKPTTWTRIGTAVRRWFRPDAKPAVAPEQAAR